MVILPQFSFQQNIDTLYLVRLVLNVQITGIFSIYF